MVRQPLPSILMAVIKYAVCVTGFIWTYCHIRVSLMFADALAAIENKNFLNSQYDTQSIHDTQYFSNYQTEQNHIHSYVEKK